MSHSKSPFLLPLALTLSTFATGCAFVSGSTQQSISVHTFHGDHEIAGVECKLTNLAGQWHVTSPGTVSVHKKYGDMSVDCAKDEGLVGRETLVSKANIAVWGNLWVGNVIGYIVDSGTGAGFDYPKSITVAMRKFGSVLGIKTPPGLTEDTLAAK